MDHVDEMKFSDLLSSRYFWELCEPDLDENQKLLCRFVRAVDNGNTPSKKDMKFLSESFKSILDGESPKKALGLSGKQSQGRRKRDVINVMRVEEVPVMEVEFLREYSGKTKEEAIANVSEGPPVIPIATLERYHKRHRKNIKELLHLMQMVICMFTMKTPSEVHDEICNSAETVGGVIIDVDKITIGEKEYRHPRGLTVRQVIDLMKKEIFESE